MNVYWAGSTLNAHLYAHNTFGIGSWTLYLYAHNIFGIGAIFGRHNVCIDIQNIRTHLHLHALTNLL